MYVGISGISGNKLNRKSNGFGGGNGIAGNPGIFKVKKGGKGGNVPMSIGHGSGEKVKVGIVGISGKKLIRKASGFGGGNGIEGSPGIFKVKKGGKGGSAPMSIGHGSGGKVKVGIVGISGKRLNRSSNGFGGGKGIGRITGILVRDGISKRTSLSIVTLVVITKVAISQFSFQL